jgi:DNA-binding CsgD family transcriptional regulator
MAPLLERDGELEMLERVAHGVTAGRGGLVLVSGEAGIGKTSLVRALRERVADRLTVLIGACELLSVPVPLAPWRELAEAAGGPDLARQSSGDRLRLARVILDALGRRSPLLAVIEDAHWADPLTVDVIRLVARRLERRPLALLVTYRDDELQANPPLAQLVGDLAGNPEIERIKLNALSRMAVDALAQEAGFQGEGLSRITGGNPFLVIETIASGGRLPASVRDASLARAGRLSQSARRVVDVAAVIGQRFEPSLLCSLADDRPEAVEEALARGVLVADEAQLGFRHELIRAALEQSISPPRRAELHGRVFRALSEQPGSADSARLAHHAELGGLTAEAARFASRAAEEAYRMGALPETALQAERALRLGAGLTDEERFEVLVRLALALNFSSPLLEDAVAVAKRAVTLAEAMHDPVRLGRALVALAWTQWSPERVVEARLAAEQAVAALAPTGELGELARAHAARIRMEATAFDPAVAIESASAALELAERAGLEEVRLDIAISVGLARGHQGLRSGIADLQKALQAARAAGLAIQTVRTYVNLMTVAVALRDHGLVERVTGEALPLLEELRTFIPALAIRLFRARSLLDRGRWDEAREIYSGCDATIQGEWAVALAFDGLIRVRRGEPAGASQIQRGWELLQRMVAAESSRHGMVRSAAVEAAWLAGDHGAARAHLQAARESFAVARFARPGSELALWGYRCGVALEPPAGAPLPVQLELAGDWRGAIRAWRELEAPYEAALAALPGDDRAAREALAGLHRIGARAAVQAFSRERAARSGREARGPRRSTLAHPAGLTRREQEVLEALATGATNTAIASALQLSERTVAHHVSAILSKLGARNRHLAVAQARTQGLLAQDGQAAKPR